MSTDPEWLNAPKAYKTMKGIHITQVAFIGSLKDNMTHCLKIEVPSIIASTIYMKLMTRKILLSEDKTETGPQY